VETKTEIESKGKFVKDEYGISHFFQWKVYDLNGDRYKVSQFSDEVEKVARIYCEVCGRAFLPSKMTICYGLNTCVYCNAEQK
jgi:hypothetical protein